MNQADRDKLRSNTVMLMRDLRIDKMFIAVLRQRRTLNDVMAEDIEVRILTYYLHFIYVQKHFLCFTNLDFVY